MKYMSDFIIYLYTMKVKELIEKLKEFDENTEVYIEDAEYWEEMLIDVKKWIKARYQNNCFSIWSRSDLEDLPKKRRDVLDRWNAVISEKEIVILYWN